MRLIRFNEALFENQGLGFAIGDGDLNAVNFTDQGDGFAVQSACTKIAGDTAC